METQLSDDLTWLKLYSLVRPTKSRAHETRLKLDHLSAAERWVLISWYLDGSLGGYRSHCLC